MYMYVSFYAVLNQQHMSSLSPSISPNWPQALSQTPSGYV